MSMIVIQSHISVRLCAVPRGASILIDVRDLEHTAQRKAMVEILTKAAETGSKWKVETKTEVVYDHPPLTASKQVRVVIRLLSRVKILQ